MEENVHVPPSRATLLRGVIASALILFVGFMLLRVFSNLRKKPKKKGAAKAISLRVNTRAVRYQNKTLNLAGYGTAVSDQQIELVPEVAGKLVYVFKPFKEGAFVKRGKLLFRIDASTYSLEYKRLKATVSSLKKQIQIARKAYKVSRINLGRSQRLVRRRALDQSSYERSQQQVLDRGQRLESLRQALAVNQLQMRRAQINLGRTGIRAPFDARITKGELTRGSFVSAGRSVGTLESVEAVEVPVAFSLSDLRKIRDSAGKPVPLQRIPQHLRSLPPAKVTADSMTWKGRVNRMGAKINLSTRTLTMYVRVDLKKQQKDGSLLPGTFCQVEIPVRHVARAVVLPRTALYEDKYIYIADGKKLGRREVSVGYMSSSSVFITGGLRQGDKAIISQLTDPVIGTPLFVSEK